MSFTGTSVIISGLSIFEAARTVSPKKARTITFDAHLWFGAGYQALAALLLYNEAGKSFPNDDVKKYFITANVRFWFILQCPLTICTGCDGPPGA